MKTYHDQITFQRWSGLRVSVHVHYDGSLSVFFGLHSVSLASLLTVAQHHRLHRPLLLCGAEGTS